MSETVDMSDWLLTVTDGRIVRWIEGIGWRSRAPFSNRGMQSRSAKQGRRPRGSCAGAPGGNESKPSARMCGNGDAKS